MLSLHFEKRKQGKGTTKVDHFNGEIYTDGNGDWNTDMRGTNAKDAADAIPGKSISLRVKALSFLRSS